eukprot:TRINITY_DN1060_c0_g1_i13.p1 TRINITY_DN1060_c0_g1~~TRINITY_DN1060_c0_g1_i13.p1  ORF type:complete len:138 (+),score=41.40 TRINITY_DN1060_c0_g1_i13:66-479(+)
MCIRDRLQMSQKMEAIAAQIKASEKNIGMVQSLNNITPILTEQSQDIPIEKLVENMSRFEEALNGIEASGKVMNQAINNNTYDANQDSAVDQALKNLKAEVCFENQNKLNDNQQMNYQQIQQMQNQNGQQINQQKQF